MMRELVRDEGCVEDEEEEEVKADVEDCVFLEMLEDGGGGDGRSGGCLQRPCSFIILEQKV